uniref:Uncharacterized protein n=1 Tax=Brassica campestris TaxID=3711 RepID=A0A3P6BIT4_BRACM|nr:unnamed protein product [Brassica rapa]
MGIFPRFGGWITQNIQQPLKVSSYPPIKGPFESSSVSETDRYIQGPWYFNPAASPKEKAEIMKIDHVRSMQVRLWRSENSKHPWYDAPAKVKMKTKKRSLPFKHRLHIGMASSSSLRDVH